MTTLDLNDNIMNLQNNINNLIHNNHIPNMAEYTSLVKDCVYTKEFGATIYVYDHLLKNKLKATEEIFQLINKLHSKTIPENCRIKVPITKPCLQPRRRIHKIMKGHLYTDQYNNALKNVEEVKSFLNKNPSIAKTGDRIKMAKQISKNCDVNFKDARYIITHLKRKKFFDTFSNQSKMTDFFK